MKQILQEHILRNNIPQSKEQCSRSVVKSRVSESVNEYKLKEDQRRVSYGSKGNTIKLKKTEMCYGKDI